MQCDGMGWDQAEPAYEFLSVWGNDLGNEKNWGHNSGTISCVSLDDAELGWAAQGGGCNGRVSLAPASFTSVRFHGPLPGLQQTTLLCHLRKQSHLLSLSLLPRLSLLSPTVVVLLAKPRSGLTVRPTNHCCGQPASQDNGSGQSPRPWVRMANRSVGPPPPAHRAHAHST